MAMDKEFGTKMHEVTHPRDVSLSVSNPTRALIRHPFRLPKEDKKNPLFVRWH